MCDYGASEKGVMFALLTRLQLPSLSTAVQDMTCKKTKHSPKQRSAAKGKHAQGLPYSVLDTLAYPSFPALQAAAVST